MATHAVGRMAFTSQGYAEVDTPEVDTPEEGEP